MKKNQEPTGVSKESSKTEAPRVKQNIQAILEMEKQAVKGRSVAENIADKVTTFAGSTPFIILHLVWFGGWIIINEGLIPGIAAFDPFPL